MKQTFQWVLIPIGDRFQGRHPNPYAEFDKVPVRYAIWTLCKVRPGITYGEVLRELRLLYWRFPEQIARHRLRRQIKGMVEDGVLAKKNPR